MNDLGERGYAVVPGVIGPELVAALLALLQDRAGVDLTDPATWAAPGFPAVWAHQAQWDVRQAPAVHAAFANAWGREDLVVSIDGLGFKPPVAVDPDGRYANAMPLHFDVDPRSGDRIFQGVVYLTDVGPDDGAFRCVPGVFADLDGWLERHPDFDHRVWADPDLEAHEVVPVAARAGDLVLFDSRLLHGNGVHRGTSPRVVQYVSLTPADAGWSPVDCYCSGMAPEHLRGRAGWGDAAPDAPADLTALGRRLAGLEAWPAGVTH